MKVIPVAINHIFLELDNGEIIDVNDGTSVPKGALTIRLADPTERYIITSTSTTYDATTRLLFERDYRGRGISNEITKRIKRLKLMED